jgi:hypothetical protein
MTVLPWIYGHGTVIGREDRDDGSIHLAVSMTEYDCAELDRRLAAAHGSN